LSGQPTSQPAANVLKILKYLATSFETARVVDPANSANVISDDLTAGDKKRIALEAAASLNKSLWNQIIW